MIHIEPLHTGVILPAFVVGHEVSRIPEPLKDLPPWMVAVDQQAGGHGMSYPSVVGAVLRLEANKERGKKDIAHLIRGFRCMAEDPDMETLRRDYPVLSRLVKTQGNEYAKAGLRDLGNVLASHFWLPPIRSGIEAFVRFAPCDPLDFFRGWRVLRCRVRRDGPLRGSTYSFPRSESYHVDEGNLSDLEMADDILYKEDRQTKLTELGGMLGRPGLPDVFFLWENSDSRPRGRRGGGAAVPGVGGGMCPGESGRERPTRAGRRAHRQGCRTGRGPLGPGLPAVPPSWGGGRG